MESNITRDHIAMEAMKEIIRAGCRDSTPLKQRIRKWLFGSHNSITGFISEAETAWEAYKFADAMIAEREKTRRNNL